MCNSILLLVFLSANFFSLGMQGPHPIVEYTFACEGSPLWRPNTQELILQKRLIRKPAHNPEDPTSFLKAHGPLVYTCIYNPTTGQEQPLEKGNELPLSMKCSSNGTYLAALTACPAQISSESTLILNPKNLLTVWNLVTRTIVLESITPQLAFTISPQEQYIATESEDNSNLLIRSLVDGSLVRTIAKKTMGSDQIFISALRDAIAFSPDDTLIAFENKGITHIINVKNPHIAPLVIEGYSPQFSIENVIKVRNGSPLFFYSTDKKDIQESEQPLQLLGCSGGTYKDKFKWRTTLDPEFRHAIIAPGFGETYYEIFYIRDNIFSSENSIIAVSADFSLYVVLEGMFAQIKKVNTKEMLHKFPQDLMGGLHIFFSQNNQYLFSENNENIVIWNFQKGYAVYKKKITNPATPYIPSVCSPECTHLLIRSAPSQATIIDLNALPYKKIVSKTSEHQ